jgi:amicyanin
MKSYCTRKSLVSTMAVLAMAAASLVLTARSHAANAENQANPAEVKIDNFTFTAPSITVPAGTEVTWTNRDDIPHNVTSDDGVFRSKALDTDDKYSFKFAKPGTYHYFCSIHPKMTGEIVVK